MAKSNKTDSQTTDTSQVTGSSTEENTSEEPTGYRATLARLHRNDQGTTSLEWALLLGAIASPSIFIFTMALNIVVDYYRMMTQLNAFPFP